MLFGLFIIVSYIINLSVKLIAYFSTKPMIAFFSPKLAMFSQYSALTKASINTFTLVTSQETDGTNSELEISICD